MKRLRAASVVLGLLLALGTSVAPATTDDRAITHLLSRATFRPRPGDVARVRALGTAAWLERQLHPERMDDSVTDAALQSLASLRIPDLLREYPRPDPRVREQVRNGEMTRRELTERYPQGMRPSASWPSCRPRGDLGIPQPAALFPGWRDTSTPLGLFV